MAKSSWIENMHKQYGDNWIAVVPPENIKNNGKRVARDILKGNISYEKYGNDFLDPKFMENLLIALNEELETYTLYYNAVSFYSQYYSYPNIGIHISTLSGTCIVYNTIITKLNQVKSSGNIGYLADTAGILYQYKNILN